MYDVLKRNWSYKLISLVLAVLFWLWVSHQGSSQGVTGDQTLTVPLVTKNIPANSVLMSKLPAVRVRLQGSNPGFNVKDLYPYVDLSNATPGEKSYEIMVDQVPGIKVIEIVPGNITLKIDTVQEKVVPVQLNLSGTPAEGREAGTPIVRPSVVSVRGPGTLLSTLDKVVVETSIAGVSDSVQTSRPVLFRDKAGNPIFGPDPTVEALSSYPTNVDIIVPILEKGLSSKRIPLRASSKGSPAQGLIIRSLTTIPDQVQVFGTADALKGLEYLNLGPVDITGITEDKTYQISLDKVSLPKGISFAPGTSFTIIAKVGPGVLEKTITGLPVQVKNLGPNLEIEQGPPSVNITVRGMPEVLNALTNDQMALWVDANGLAAGKHPDLKVFWQLPPGVEMISTPTVTLTLKETAPKPQ